MSGSYVRFIAEDKARNDFDGINRIVSTALCYNTAFGAFIVFSGMLGKPLIMRLFVRDASQAGMIDAIYLPALLLFSFNYVGNVFQSLLDGIQRMDVRNVAQITQKVIQVVLIVVFLEKGMGLAGLIMSGFIANGIFLVGSYALAKYLVPQFTLGFSLVDGHKFKSMFSYGLKSQVTNLCAWSNNNANKLILGASGMLTGVAYFDVAQKLETFVRTPPVSLFSSLIPAVSESHTLEDRSRLEALYRKASVALVRLIFPLCFFVLFNAAYITQSWVGRDFYASGYIVRVLVFGALVNLLTGIGTSFVRGINKPEIEMKYAVVSAVLNVAFCLFFVRDHGVNGAAWALALANILASLYFLVYFHRMEKIDNVWYLKHILLIPCAVAFLFNFPIALFNGSHGVLFFKKSGLIVLFFEGALMQLLCWLVMESTGMRLGKGWRGRTATREK